MNFAQALVRRLTARRQTGQGALTGIVSITMVRNEQDIIEPFLRHHSPLLDAMILLDNGSVDRTRDIAAACASELGNIVVTDFPAAAYTQGKFLSDALRHVQGAFFSDFVCFLDADEFLLTPSRAALAASLAIIPAGSCGNVAWQTYLPDPQSAEGTPDPLTNMTWRRRSEGRRYTKSILHLGGRLDPDLAVQQGSHRIRDAFGRKLPSVDLPDLPLMHFPVRSSAQIAVKGVLGWQANLARNPAQSQGTEAFQWKRLHDRFAGGFQPLSPGELTDEAMAYALHGPPASFTDNAVPAVHGIDLTRRFSDGSFGDPTDLIASAKRATPMAGQSFTLPAPRDRSVGHAGIENAFDGDWHWDYLFLDAPPLRHVIEKYRPASVLDVGCGNGAYPLLAKASGVTEVLGLDGIECRATVLPEAEYAKVDLQVPYAAGRTFDLVVCLEVIEHVHSETTAVVMDTMERHARDLILFSMAEPGQPGNGHINCLAMAEVLKLWADRGWQPDLVDTLGVRALATMSWFRRNLVVLKRGPQPKGDAAALVLKRIGGLTYRWYDQKPGVRLAAFHEPFPDLRQAYGLVR